MADTLVRVENAGKKFSKNLSHMMFYGIQDIARNVLGMEARTEVTRKGEFWAVDDMSFELKRGETLGVIGPNGSGKTTLLKLLNGIFMPDKGAIQMKGKVGALIQVGAGFHPLLTGRENIYVNGAILGMDKKEIDKKFDSIVAFADIGDFLDSPVKHYSSGMYVRLGFSIAIHCEPDILLVDEVLAVGDIGFQNKCFNEIGKLRKNGTTIVLVSHDMHVISTYTKNVLMLDKGRGEYYENSASGINDYTRRFFEQREGSSPETSGGNGNIKFYETNVVKRTLDPGETFFMDIKYTSLVDYDDVDIDMTIRSSREADKYFQATNKTYGKRIDLVKGDHLLRLGIEDIRINNAAVSVNVAIWNKDRTEFLFRWSIPVSFNGVELSTGRNFLKVSYELT